MNRSRKTKKKLKARITTKDAPYGRRVVIDPNLYETLQDVAADQDRSVSYVARALLHLGLEAWERSEYDDVEAPDVEDAG